MDPQREFVVGVEKWWDGGVGVERLPPAKHDVNCEKQQATDGLLGLFRRVHLT